MFQKLSIALLVLVIVLFQSSSAVVSVANVTELTPINYIPLNATTQAASISCSMCKSNTLATNDACYCDDEAEKVLNCVKGVNPAWPFLPIDPADANAVCPSPATDPTGFQTCMDKKRNKPDPNSDTTIKNCAISTGAKASTSSAPLSMGAASSIFNPVSFAFALFSLLPFLINNAL